jgi:hypothetical protein
MPRHSRLALTTVCTASVRLQIVNAQEMAAIGAAGVPFYGTVRAPGCTEPLTTVTRTASSPAPSVPSPDTTAAFAFGCYTGVTNLAISPTDRTQDQTPCPARCDSRAGVEVQSVEGLWPTAGLLAPIQYCQCCIQRGFAVDVFSEVL